LGLDGEVAPEADESVLGLKIAPEVVALERKSVIAMLLDGLEPVVFLH